MGDRANGAILRADALKLKKMKKAIGEDAAKDAEESLQKAVKKSEGEVEKMVAAREKEILTV